MVLLAAGLVLGPDVTNVIRPATLGSAGTAIIGFAVAIILFEGGMRLEIGRMRKQAKGSRPRSRTLARAQIDARSCVLAVTANPSMNVLFARHVTDDLPGPRVLAPSDPETGDVLGDRGVGTLFGTPVALGAWIARWRRGQVELIRRVFAGTVSDSPLPPAPPDLLLPLVVERGDRVTLVDDRTRVTAGDVVELAFVSDRRAEADAYFAAGPWHEETELAA